MPVAMAARNCRPYPTRRCRSATLPTPRCDVAARACAGRDVDLTSTHAAIARGRPEPPRDAARHEPRKRSGRTTEKPNEEIPELACDADSVRAHWRRGRRVLEQQVPGHNSATGRAARDGKLDGRACA